MKPGGRLQIGDILVQRPVGDARVERRAVRHARISLRARTVLRDEERREALAALSRATG